MSCETIHPLALSSGPMQNSSTVLTSLLAAHACVVFHRSCSTFCSCARPSVSCFWWKLSSLARVDLSLKRLFFFFFSPSNPLHWKLDAQAQLSPKITEDKVLWVIILTPFHLMTPRIGALCTYHSLSTLNKSRSTFMLSFTSLSQEEQVQSTPDSSSPTPPNGGWHQLKTRTPLRALQMRLGHCSRHCT